MNSKNIKFPKLQRNLKKVLTEVSDDYDGNTLCNSIAEENGELLNGKEISGNLLSKHDLKRKNSIWRKIILSATAITVICALIVSFFACVSAYNKYSIISSSIHNMNTSNEDFKVTIQKKNIVYNILFKRKNEKEILDLLKNNLYDVSTIELVNLESVEKVQQIKEICDNLKLDRTEYSDIYLYIETVIGLKKYSGYQIISDILDKTLPLITNSSVGTSAYYTIDAAAMDLYQFALILERIAEEIYNQTYDPYVMRYYNCILELHNDYIKEAIDALAKHDNVRYQQKLSGILTATMKITDLSKEVENAKQNLRSDLLKLSKIVEQLENKK